MICASCGDEVRREAQACARCGAKSGEAPAGRRADLADFVAAPPRALSSVRRLFGLSTAISPPKTRD